MTEALATSEGFNHPIPSEPIYPVSDGSSTPASEEFSTLSNFKSIAALCIPSVPGWSVSDPSRDIVIEQLMEGLSNQLFKVTLKTQGASVAAFRTVLFRIYGEHVSSFYNPEFELEVFKALSEFQIGPKMIANGEGWRIEEYYESVVLKTSSLPNPAIFTQVAAQLGRLHKLHKSEHFLPKHARDHLPISLARLRDWTREGLSALDRLPDSASKKSSLRIDEILIEVEKIYSKLHASSIAPNKLGYDIVFCHNDVQENNILMTPYGLRLIDFEYANFNFQSADIGNLFNEFTMDYIHDEWPFFKKDLSAYPGVETQRMFSSVYLSEYLDQPVMLDNPLIDELLDSVKVASQLSHLLWGMWSLVRAQQYAETSNSFDFVEYARFRFDTYWANAI